MKLESPVDNTSEEFTVNPQTFWNSSNDKKSTGDRKMDGINPSRVEKKTEIGVQCTIIWQKVYQVVIFYTVRFRNWNRKYMFTSLV
jgi:hypothetical protein